MVGRLSQDRRGVLADEADDGCVGVEGHISAKPFAIQANPIIEFSPDVLQNFQMGLELVHCSTAMLGHDEHVEAPLVHPICQLGEDVACRQSLEISKCWEHRERWGKQLQLARHGQMMPAREAYFGRVGGGDVVALPIIRCPHGVLFGDGFIGR